MRKLYLISYYFAPLGRADGVNRTYLVKYLSEMGWDVEVVTGKKYKSLVLNFQEDSSLLDILPKSIKVHHFESHKGWLLYDLKKVFRLGNNLRRAWIKNAMNNIQLDRNSIVCAIVPPIDNAFLAYQLAQKYHCPLVLYYPDDVLEVERHIVEQADLIVAVTPQIKKSISDYYQHKNIIVAANGYAEALALPEKKEREWPIRIAYAGSLNFRTRPEIFARACRELAKQDQTVAEKLEIDFFGPPGYYASLLLKPYLSPQIQFKGYLPFNSLIHTLPHYDMALSSMTDSAFASKIYHYLNAGLPIFGVFKNRGLGKFISEHQIGVVSTFKINDIIDQLKMLLANKDQILDWRKNVLKIRDQYGLKSSAFLISNILKTLSQSS